MTTVDEQQLRGLAQELVRLFAQLEELKWSNGRQPEVRVMKPAPGSQPPGNWFYLATGLDQERNLREVAFNALGDTNVKIRDDETSGIALCRKLAFHAQPISELDWASDLVDDLMKIAGVLRKRCQPATITEVSEAPERRLGAEAIARQLRARRHHVTADMVRGWARAGYITRDVMPNGRGGYLLSECLASLVGQP